MTGMMSVLASSGRTTRFLVTIDSGSPSGSVSGASGTTVAMRLGFSTNGPDDSTTFSFSSSRVGGSSKISLNQTAGAISGNTPQYAASWSGFAVGETQSTSFKVQASKSGYEPSTGGDITYTITRTS